MRDLEVKEYIICSVCIVSRDVGDAWTALWTWYLVVRYGW